MTVPISLLVTHFVGDFLFQSDWMALNKSKRLEALVLHAGIYSTVFALFGVEFVLITFVTHAITDAITSRITSKLWFLPIEPWYDQAHEEIAYQAFPKPYLRHWFFVMIGLDQLIHYFTLAWTYRLVF